MKNFSLIINNYFVIVENFLWARLRLQPPGGYTCRPLGTTRADSGVCKKRKKGKILIMTKKRLIKLAVKMIIAVLNHHRQHAEVGFFADDPDDVALAELALGLGGIKMSLFVFYA